MALQLDGTLLLAGAGNMGYALLSGWLERGLDPARIVVQDPAPPPRAKELILAHGIELRSLVSSLWEPPAVIVVAVKPQAMDRVFPPLAQLARSGKTLVLSVAAGRPIDAFEQHLPKDTAVIRCMPNTPASVGRGITVATGNRHVTPAQRAACEALLRAVGEFAWVGEEGLLDAVTAVSGSGPAYVFYLTECLADAGIKAGLEPALAQKLARWTVAGAGELLHRSDLGPDLLRQNVTSPNGTTFAALQVLMAENGLAKLMHEAVAAAARRSRELAR
ncbi:MAG: pyrroline-5-carboxylate reductase [Hyphomicrobiaceae bacterium]|nr:MAG: pyrroline-5-carboxylate reductase [Hyphomicrobiaceae bacterium]